MVSPFIVDANVMNKFQSERVKGTEAVAQDAINSITAATFIALDAEGHCEAEWLECAAGTYPLALKDWIADMMATEKIQLFSYTCASMFRELSGIGVPKKDHKWVRLARSVSADYIVSEDIDLFDPAKKRTCTAAQRRAILESSSGPVAKYLKKTHSLNVICCTGVGEALANSN